MQMGKCLRRVPERQEGSRMGKKNCVGRSVCLAVNGSLAAISRPFLPRYLDLITLVPF